MTRDSALLTDEELAYAKACGAERSAAARRRAGPNNRCNHRYGWKPSLEVEFDTDVISSVAEFLVAKMTGRRWLSDGPVPDDPMAGDVEGGLQVRWTPRTNGCLIVHPTDPDELTYVLVRGPLDSLEVAGCRPGAECKQERFWRADVRYPAFFVPYRALDPITTVRREQ